MAPSNVIWLPQLNGLRPFSVDMRIHMVDAFRAGMNLDQIAEAVGTNSSVVQMLILKHLGRRRGSFLSYSK